LSPLTVAFSNLSSGDYQTRQWDLGDGQISILENPTHTYQARGRYTVTLTVVGPGGSDTRTKAEYITVLWGGYLPLILRPM
jgi:PKD repeat protein